MPVVDVFEHMEEAWKLERNPFPAEAIRAQHAEQPYSPAVFSEEENAFRRKLIRGAVRGGLRIPVKSAADSETKPATYSDFIPATIPI